MSYINFSLAAIEFLGFHAIFRFKSFVQGFFSYERFSSVLMLLIAISHMVWSMARWLRSAPKTGASRWKYTHNPFPLSSLAASIALYGLQREKYIKMVTIIRVRRRPHQPTRPGGVGGRRRNTVPRFHRQELHNTCAERRYSYDALAPKQDE